MASSGKLHRNSRRCGERQLRARSGAVALGPLAGQSPCSHSFQFLLHKPTGLMVWNERCRYVGTGGCKLFWSLLFSDLVNTLFGVHETSSSSPLGISARYGGRDQCGCTPGRNTVSSRYKSDTPSLNTCTFSGPAVNFTALPRRPLWVPISLPTTG